MNPMQQPQQTDQADLPLHPVVAGTANQTNARTGGMPAPGPEIPAYAATDPGWAARVALNNKLNPPPGTPAPVQESPIATFSRALPSNGAPTPTFAPAAGQLMANPQVGLALLHGITPEHAAGAQALAGQPITSPSAAAPAPGQRYDNGPATVQEGQQRLAAYPNWQDQPQAQPQTREAAAMQAGIDPNHPGLAPHKMTKDEYVAAMRSVPLSAFQKMQELRRIPSMQEQAQSAYAQIGKAEGPASFANAVMQEALRANYPMQYGGYGMANPNAPMQ